MPHLDGFELTRLVRKLKLNGQIPIVMLTASDDGETMRKGFDMGINFFLGKPFTRERVYKLLGAIKGSMAREQLRYVRVPFRTTVGCSWGFHAAGHFKSDCQDISEGGMRLSPLGGLEVGQGVSLAFILPGISEKLSVNGQVVRKVPDGGIGMKFIALPLGKRHPFSDISVRASRIEGAPQAAQTCVLGGLSLRSPEATCGNPRLPTKSRGPTEKARATLAGSLSPSPAGVFRRAHLKVCSRCRRFSVKTFWPYRQM